MRYPLIVFDWDGTVIDSPAAIVECMQAASRDLGLPVPERSRTARIPRINCAPALRAGALRASRRWADG